MDYILARLQMWAPAFFPCRLGCSCQCPIQRHQQLYSPLSWCYSFGGLNNDNPDFAAIFWEMSLLDTCRLTSLFLQGFVKEIKLFFMDALIGIHGPK